MVVGYTGSSVPRRQLGRALRGLRAEARMTLEGAAEAVRFSRQKLWRIETGREAVRGPDVRALCAMYAAPAELTGALVALAGETSARGWWHSYGDPLPHWFEVYPGLEAEACRLREYRDMLVPGLVQTREYAYAVRWDRPDLTEAERERRIGVRLRRQGLLRRRTPVPPRLEVVLSEAVLQRPVGSPATLVDQLHHLRDAGTLPHVSIRIVPLSAGPHFGAISGGFVLLDFPTGHRSEPDPSVVYRESLTGALYLDQAHEVAAYEKAWASLDELALTEDESRELISDAIDSLPSTRSSVSPC
ncbi:helix-turn-helix transcriptional regulator [Micromonospora sp. CPCC 206060]|uniref:helix-turn-helix domain-containing protein n=1 Tax=Micromonospora sp. CPCC 206060 TaxID=3122406 RepID=UPI002FEFA203